MDARLEGTGVWAHQDRDPTFSILEAVTAPRATW